MEAHFCGQAIKTNPRTRHNTVIDTSIMKWCFDHVFVDCDLEGCFGQVVHDFIARRRHSATFRGDAEEARRSIASAGK